MKNTENLIQSVSDRFLNEDDGAENVENGISQSPKQNGKGSSKSKPPPPPPKPTPILPVPAILISRNQRKGFRIYPPPSVFIKISIPTLGDSHSKALGLINDPENVTFHIHMKALKLNPNKLENNRPVRDVILQCTESECIRRHSEVKKLYTALSAEFPYVIIPPHPSRHQIATSSGLFQNDSKKDFRHRTYALWLEYIANLPALHTGEVLCTFFNAGMSLEGSVNFDLSRIDREYHRLVLPFIEEVTIGIRQLVPLDFTPEYRRVYYELYDEFTQILKTRTLQDILNIRR